MSLEHLKQLRDLLDEFYADRDAELAKSVALASTQNLASKICDIGSQNLSHIKFTRNWVHSTYTITPGYKPDVAPF